VWNASATAPAATESESACMVIGSDHGGYHCTDNLYNIAFGMMDVTPP
jgi:hypothetical protein